jgi:hypothetical protein
VDQYAAERIRTKIAETLTSTNTPDPVTSILDEPVTPNIRDVSILSTFDQTLWFQVAATATVVFPGFAIIKNPYYPVKPSITDSDSSSSDGNLYSIYEPVDVFMIHPVMVVTTVSVMYLTWKYTRSQHIKILTIYCTWILFVRSLSLI